MRGSLTTTLMWAWEWSSPPGEWSVARFISKHYRPVCSNTLTWQIGGRGFGGYRWQPPHKLTRLKGESGKNTINLTS